MEFFSSNWLENLTKMLFVLIDWSAQLLRRRLKRNSSQQMSQKNFSIWREELHALAKEFQVSCIIKIDHKQPTINPYFMKKLCRSSWCYHTIQLTLLLGLSFRHLIDMFLRSCHIFLTDLRHYLYLMLVLTDMWRDDCFINLKLFLGIL